MNTLNNQINEIKNSNLSYDNKVKELVKLGIRQQDVCFCIGNRPCEPKAIFTFGVELETIGINRFNAINEASNNGLRLEYQGYNHVDSHEVYKFVTDGSINGENAIECVTPVLSSKGGLNSLKTLCDVLNHNGARVNASCGTHVHIGVAGMTDDWYRNVFYNYQQLESVIDTFMARSRRANNSNWCRTLTDHDFSYCHTIQDVRREMSCDRYHKVNPEAWARHNTIEFRQHQGTTDFKKISNWVKFCGKLVVWSKNHVIAGQVTSIDDIEFLTKAEKDFFKSRAIALA